MKTFRNVLFLASVLSSSNIFACKVTTEMASSRLFMGGLANRLSEIEKFKDYSIMSTSYVSYPNVYNVVIKNVESGKCMELKMESYGTESCDFTADIITEKVTACESVN